MVKDRVIKAGYLEYQASIFGATFAALGVAVIFYEYIKPYYIPLIIFGLALHGYGMYKVNKRNI